MTQITFISTNPHYISVMKGLFSCLNVLELTLTLEHELSKRQRDLDASGLSYPSWIVVVEELLEVVGFKKNFIL